MKALRWLVITLGTLVLTTLGINAFDNIDNPKDSLLGAAFRAYSGSGCDDGMVFVGSSNGGFCVDAYEASTGEDCQYRDPQSRSESGDNLSLSACEPVSEPKQIPWRNITREQAALACARVEKRLPSSEEWYRAAERGILIKNAESLEKLSKVTAIVFDKTGTLTHNKLAIEGIYCKDKNHTCDEAHTNLHKSLIYSITKSSKHPVSESVANWLKENNVTSLQITNLVEVAGKGVKAQYQGTTYYLGSRSYISEVIKQSEKVIQEDFDSSRFENGRELYLSDDKEVLSLIKIHDTIKAEAKDEIIKLKKLGLKVVMATGDHKKTSDVVAKNLGIDYVYSDVAPEDKLNIVKELQSKGLKVAMIGDGVNDAPALAQADVAISMSDGSDIAIESSDIVLLRGDIQKVAEAIHLAQRTNKIVWQNLISSFAYNSIGLPIAGGILYPFFGFLLSPAIAGAIMAFESVTVVMNSLRIKSMKL
jgi:cation transport ATPase